MADPRSNDEAHSQDAPYVLVLGIAQDAGYPQAGCANACCAPAWQDHRLRRHAACLAIVDPPSGRRWMLDATPDFKEQLRMLDLEAGPRITTFAADPSTLSGGSEKPLEGIFLTHAHAGHYPGLIHLGPEAMGARDIPLHLMPKMQRFLSDNLPWADLIEGGSFTIRSLQEGIPVKLTDDLQITPFRVPHRDEHSETVGFVVEGPCRSLAYIPDIDRWEDWDAMEAGAEVAERVLGVDPHQEGQAGKNGKLEALLARVDIALVDGSFFDADELPGRDLGLIPHPRVVDTMARLAPLDDALRARLRFTHLNHSNPLLQAGSEAREKVSAAGFGVVKEGERLGL